LFSFVQFEFPRELGPADGRYVIREGAGADASHVLVLRTLGATERRRLARNRPRPAEPEPAPTPVPTTRATVIGAVGREREAALQLRVALEAGIAELEDDPRAERLAPRLAELREQRGPVGDAANAALGGPLEPTTREAVGHALTRLEAALRARAVAAL